MKGFGSTRTGRGDLRFRRSTATNPARELLARWLFVVMLALQPGLACHRLPDAGLPPGETPDLGLRLPFYGTQFVPREELAYVRGLGFEVVLQDFSYEADPSEWKAYLDAAQANGLRVIPWLWPEGWKLDRRTGKWSIDETARRFLRVVGTHPATLAVHALHEPYWMGCETCGYTTAEQQALCRAIGEIVRVPVYSEIDGFDFWAATGPEKTIAPGVCDFCQTKHYPFLAGGTYQREEMLQHLDKEIAALKRYSPESRLVWTMPAFEYAEDALRMPTAEEMRDCARVVYERGEIAGAWWYPWRWDNDLYSSSLALHPELHPTVREIAETIVAAAKKRFAERRNTRLRTGGRHEGDNAHPAFR